jgi:hypothetical protein
MMLSFMYEDKTILRSVSLKIEKGKDGRSGRSSGAVKALG